MTNLYSIIGEHRDNPDRFLLIGEDGQRYVTDITMTEPTPVETDDEYVLDPAVREFGDLARFDPNSLVTPLGDWPVFDP